MEEKFYKDDLEQFLQQQANNHRMYPTDRVWQGIYKKLHGDKRWPALTIAAFAFLTATIAISVYFAPKPNIFAFPPQKATIVSVDNLSKSSNPLIDAVSNKEESIKGKNYVSQVNSTPGFKNSPSIAIKLINDKAAAISKATIPDLTVNTVTDVTIKSKTISPVLFGTTAKRSEALDVEEITARLPIALSPAPDLSQNAAIAQVENVTTTTEKRASSKKEQDPEDKNIADDYLKQHKDDIGLYTTSRQINARKKFSYTVYIAPSISYRKLKEDETLNSKNVNLNGPVALNYVTDVNKVVRHKPGTGIEAGVSFTYHLTNTFGIKAGLQFNIRQYNIEAYRAPMEVAPIALLSRSSVDTINTYAVYRNNNGYIAADLVNRYYQLSIPVGFEWEVVGSKKLKLNLAANIQPTYIMNRNSYLLSTNFKNYTEDPGMLRNWNANSNIEAFMSFKVGDFRWQLGPQLRYQLLPTFITEYPIREHLMDYGFKIGVSKFIK